MTSVGMGNSYAMSAMSSCWTWHQLLGPQSLAAAFVEAGWQSGMHTSWWGPLGYHSIKIA
jgi:hypothetical protein